MSDPSPPILPLPPLSRSLPHPGFCEDYRFPSGVYDEMCSAPGVLRPQWEYLMRAFAAMGPEELARRIQEARRLLRDNGVTYNIYDDLQGPEPRQGRPWALDPIPVLLTSQEWSGIERGLIQRAELLDLVLADLYGPRKLMRKGLLPPELVYIHPGFLRPCDGMRAAGGHHLQLYAADLGRAPDGTVWVIGDRSQVPSGAGYALENRIVLSRILPSLYRDSQVHRVAVFFRTLRNTLAQLALVRGDNPRIVVLTPGPGNETYFEHAYLANYLGYPLVQGNDLTVRDGRVWLKTLERLQPVDVILRRVDESFCDPLELRGDSVLGTPGLLHAVRTGHVAVVNALGSGVLENPALMAFLPGICRQLLGEELRIPSVETWWCGEAQGCEHVLANLERLVIKPVAPHPSSSTIFGRRLTAAQREALAAEIRARPQLFVGQEEVALSTAPVLEGSCLAPRPLVLRAFLTARDETYAVMPSGLSRASSSLADAVVSSQQGGIAKDTWILASEPEMHVSLLPAAERPLALTRTGGEVPSRVADNLFWLGRYAERTEGAARLLREVLLQILETEAPQPDRSLAVLLRAVTHHAGTYPGFADEDTKERVAEQELLSVITDGRRMGSLRASVTDLVQAGRSVRDRLSRDAWRIINNVDEEFDHAPSLSDALENVERLIIALAAFAGLSAESMSRGQGWRFLSIGRRIERALQTINLLRATVVSAGEPDGALWEAVLAITDSVKTYRRRYRSQMQVGAVLDLLLHDESNPRSVGFQLMSLQEDVVGLPRKNAAPHRSPEERLVLEALTALRLSDADELAQVPPGKSVREGLDQLSARLGYLLGSLSDALSRSYFTHTEMPKQLGVPKQLVKIT